MAARSSSALPISTNGLTILVLAENKILLLKRRHQPLKNEWSFIAGKIKKGESPRAAAARELAEETGLKNQALEIPGFCEQYFNADSGCLVIRSVFLVFPEKIPKIKLNREHSKARWCHPEEALALLKYPTQRMLVHQALETRP